MQLLERLRVHAFVLQQIEDHARIEAPVRVPMGRPSTAVKPIVVATLRPRAIAHMLAPLPRCATISLPSAHSGAMRGQHRDDVFVGEAVKAVAADALGRQVARGSANCCASGGCRPVKRGIETGDLGHIRRDSGDGAYRGEIMRLVQRRERNQRFQVGKHLVVDQRQAPHKSIRHARRGDRSRRSSASLPMMR